MHDTVYALYLSKPSMETGGLVRGKGPIGEGKHPQRSIYNRSPQNYWRLDTDLHGAEGGRELALGTIVFNMCSPRPAIRTQVS
jgi:hypothetical protein